jgi:hypothetical protein
MVNEGWWVYENAMDDVHPGVITEWNVCPICQIPNPEKIKC